MGPCLCGDPYCPSCGNPSAAKWADLMVTVCERIGATDDVAIAAVERVLSLMCEDADLCAAIETWGAKP